MQNKRKSLESYSNISLYILNKKYHKSFIIPECNNLPNIVSKMNTIHYIKI